MRLIRQPDKTLIYSTSGWIELTCRGGEGWRQRERRRRRQPSLRSSLTAPVSAEPSRPRDAVQVVLSQAASQG